MLEFTIVNQQQNQRFTHPGGRLEFGRRAESFSGAPRFVISDQYVSRDQLCVEELPGEKAWIKNLGRPIILPDDSTLGEGDVREFDLPLQLEIGYTTLGIECVYQEDEPGVVQSLQSLPRVQSFNSGAARSQFGAASAPAPETLTHWFESLLAVQRSAANTSRFYDEAAKAVVELIGLDRGSVLLCTGGDWRPEATYGAGASGHILYSHTVLEKVTLERCTFYQSPDKLGAASLEQVDAVVASPIFDAQDSIVGAVYGSRDVRSKDYSSGGITSLEAQLVQVVAGAVSTGLARLEKEAEAARNRVQLERFVSPQVALQLERNPRLLEGNEREITVLFADLRGFSAIAERLGARETYRLTSDVLDRLTNAVMDHEGAVIDYYGDGLAAMWNAPVDQPGHATLACQAALAMLNALPELNAEWEARAEAPIRIGAGIHTGVAQVGNAGTPRRLKFGPRGHTVNLASRIEGATKVFASPILLSRPAYDKLEGDFTMRRVGRVRMVGVENDVELWELYGPIADPDWPLRRDKYETAVHLWEEGRAEQALEQVQLLLHECPSDATASLLATALGKTSKANTPSEPVFVLERK